jgi:hypothetical protein
MFRWFQRQKPQDPKLARAYQLGRETANSFADDLKKLMQLRFGPVAERYLDVVQKQFNACLNPTEAPPIIVARMEYNAFLDNVNTLRDQMTGEILSTLSDYMDIAYQLDSRDKFVELVQVEVQNYCQTLSEDGLQRFLDMAHALKLADDDWRLVHPELSAQIPRDA